MRSCLAGTWVSFLSISPVSRNQIERRGLAVDDVAGEQAVVAHRLGDRGQPLRPVMLHRGAGEFEVAGAALPAMLAVDEVDDVHRMLGGKLGELRHVLVLAERGREL